MRLSVYKEKIMELLAKGHLFSIADIQKGLNKVDFSTVFRNIEQLVHEGVVKKVVINKSTILYEAIKHGGSHDHFVCDHCGIVESVTTSKVNLNGKAIASDVLIRGACNNCVK